MTDFEFNNLFPKTPDIFGDNDLLSSNESFEDLKDYLTNSGYNSNLYYKCLSCFNPDTLYKLDEDALKILIEATIKSYLKKQNCPCPTIRFDSLHSTMPNSKTLGIYNFDFKTITIDLFYIKSVLANSFNIDNQKYTLNCLLLLETILHECRHAVQDYEFGKRNSNNLYSSNVIDNCVKYYDIYNYYKNSNLSYYSNALELDAREQTYIELSNNLAILGMSDIIYNRKLQNDRLLNKLLDGMHSKLKQQNYNINEYFS